MPSGVRARTIMLDSREGRALARNREALGALLARFGESAAEREMGALILTDREPGWVSTILRRGIGFDLDD